MAPEVTAEIIADGLIFDATPGFPGRGVYHGWDGVGQDFFGQIMPLYDSFYAGAEQFYADDRDHASCTSTTTPRRRAARRSRSGSSTVTVGEEKAYAAVGFPAPSGVFQQLATTQPGFTAIPWCGPV